MRKILQSIAGVTAIAVLFTMGWVAYDAYSLADEYYVQQGDTLNVGHSGVIATKSTADIIPVSTGNLRQTNVELSLMGLIPIKQAQITELSQTMLIPSGKPFGIKILTEGVMVVGLNGIETTNGLKNPAKEAGIQIGDVIHSINGQEVKSNQDIAQLVQQAGANEIEVSLTNQNNKEKTVHLTPVKSITDGEYKAGIWVRDSSAGIGTITFCEPETNIFGGLGHPVCDVDTGMILPISSGEIVGATISGVKKGTSGHPGELIGSFTSDKPIGTVSYNTEMGVFGSLNQTEEVHQPIPLGLKQDIHTGEATIYTTISGSQPKEYKIEIESIDMNEKNASKNMVIKITDPALIEETGGIVQGMSGSPIIQDGKLVGAVTHVFVNDPLQGYGIFAENMLSEGNSLMLSAAATAA